MTPEGKTIRDTARRICRRAGRDPDEKLLMFRSMPGLVPPVRRPRHMQYPAWTDYIKEAKAKLASFS